MYEGRIKKGIWLVFFVVTLMSFMVGAIEQPHGRLKLLVLSGMNNHPWEQTTPVLENLYHDSGHFEVVITNDPSTLTTEKLSEFDVVVSNWTNYPSEERVWGDEAEKALMDFVRDGKGLVVFHAASSCFHTWPDYQKLIGATWGKNTGHGNIHTFEVTIEDGNHSITDGLERFWIHDELWHRMEVQPGAHVLCRAYSNPEQNGTGRNEPVAFTTSFGEGRGFNLVLGHDTIAMANPYWELLMLRGAEWAATGTATIDMPFNSKKLLDEIRQYHRYQNRAALVNVEQMVNFAAQEPEMKKKIADDIAKYLEADVSEDCRQFLSQQLSLIGDDSHASALAQCIRQKKARLSAVESLMRIDGPQSRSELRKLLNVEDTAIRITVANALGNIGDEEAVLPLALMAKDTNHDVATAAISALGRIATYNALTALNEVQPKTDPSLINTIAHARLQCADAVSKEQPAVAREVYANLYKSRFSAPIRAAALIGLAGLGGDLDTLVIDALRSNDLEIQEAAISAFKRRYLKLSATPVFSKFDMFDITVQSKLLYAAVSLEQGTVGLDAAKKVIQSENSELQKAAFFLLGHAGDAAVAEYLIGILNPTNNEELTLTRQTLIQIADPKIEDALIRMIPNVQPETRIFLIEVLSERQNPAVIETLATLTLDEDKNIRMAAVRALGSMGVPEAFQPLLEVLVSSSDERFVKEAERSILRLYKSYEPQLSELVQLRSSAQKAEGINQISMLTILAPISPERTYPLVEQLLDSEEDAMKSKAIQLLSKWPTAEPAPRLYKIAFSDDEMRIRILALRAFARVCVKAPEDQADLIVQWITAALADWLRVEEKILLLSALRELVITEALHTALVYLEDPAVNNEAAQTVLTLCDKLIEQENTAVTRACHQILKADLPEAVQLHAWSLLIDLEQPTNLALEARADSPDGLEKDSAEAGGDAAGNDGNPETYWDEEDNHLLYRYRLTFQEPKTFSLLRIIGYQHLNYAPRTFEVLCDSKVVASIENANYYNNRLVVRLPVTIAKTIELRITASYGLSPAIRELEVYHTQTEKDL